MTQQTTGKHAGTFASCSFASLPVHFKLSPIKSNGLPEFYGCPTGVLIGLFSHALPLQGYI